MVKKEDLEKLKYSIFDKMSYMFAFTIIIIIVCALFVSFTIPEQKDCICDCPEPNLVGCSGFEEVEESIYVVNQTELRESCDGYCKIKEGKNSKYFNLCIESCLDFDYLEDDFKQIVGHKKVFRCVEE